MFTNPAMQKAIFMAQVLREGAVGLAAAGETGGEMRSTWPPVFVARSVVVQAQRVYGLRLSYDCLVQV